MAIGHFDVRDTRTSTGLRNITGLDPAAMKAGTGNADDFNKATERGWKPARDRIVQEKLSAQVEILDIGITKFDPQQGSAEVLAAVNVTNTHKGKKLSPVPLRLVTQLKKVGGAWKVDNFAPAPSIDASNGSE